MATTSYCPFCGTPERDGADACPGCGRSAAERLSVTTESHALPPTQMVTTVDAGEAGPNDPTRGVSRDALLGGDPHTDTGPMGEAPRAVAPTGGVSGEAPVVTRDTSPLGGAPKVVRHTPTLGSILPPKVGAKPESALSDLVLRPDVSDTHEVDVSPTYDEALRAESQTVAKAPDRQALEIANLETRALPAAPVADAPPTQLVPTVSVDEPEASHGLAWVAAALGVTAVFGVVVVLVLIVASIGQEDEKTGPFEGVAASDTGGVSPSTPVPDGGPATASDEPVTDATDGGNLPDEAPALAVEDSEPPSASADPGSSSDAGEAAQAPAPDAGAALAPKPRDLPAQKAEAPPKPAVAAPSKEEAPSSAPPSRPADAAPNSGNAKRPPAETPRTPADVLVTALFVNPKAVKPPYVHRSVAPQDDAWGVVQLGGVDALVLPASPDGTTPERTAELVETLRVIVVAHREAKGGDVVIIGIENTPWLVWRARSGAAGPRGIEIMPLRDGDLAAMSAFETRESLVRRWAQLPGFLTDLLDVVALGQEPSRVKDAGWLAAADRWLDLDGRPLDTKTRSILNAHAWRTP